jgi:hypothetical protein
VLPLSATMISHSTSSSRNARWAFSIQVPSVSASFKHGITTDTSGDETSLGVSRSVRPADLKSGSTLTVPIQSNSVHDPRELR